MLRDVTPCVVCAAGRKFVVESLRSLCGHGAKVVRLDAFGYALDQSYHSPYVAVIDISTDRLDAFGFGPRQVQC